MRIWKVCSMLTLVVGGLVVVMEIDSLAQYMSNEFVRQGDNARSKQSSNSLDATSRIHSRSTQHEDRIHRIISKCHNTTAIKPELAARQSPIVYYYSKEYNFSFCKVPKGGSTFWTQAFSILKYGLEQSDSIFKKDRYKLHGSQAHFRTDFNSDDRKLSDSILISRDPYSRLFSAFIDKSFIPNLVSLNLHIDASMNKTKSYCFGNPTFEDFLRHVISRARAGVQLDRHWATINSLCRPCDVNAFILVKQETFSKDVEYSLQQVGVERDKYDVIVDALYGHRVEATIPGIIGTIMAKTMSDARISKCLGIMEVMKRTWISFQIQGFLKDNVRFPSERFSAVSDTLYTTTLTQEVLRTIRDNPMTSQESKTQRRTALVKAYADISEETINGIREVYHNDFEIFDYCIDPPKMS